MFRLPQATAYKVRPSVLTPLTLKDNKTLAVAEMGDRGHNRIDMGRKEGGGCCAPFAGELGPHLTQCGLGRGLLPYQVASSSIQPFGGNVHGPKIGWGVIGDVHNTPTL